MVLHFEKVKNYLFELGFDIQSEDADEGVVFISNEEDGIQNLMIDCEDEVLEFRQFIFKLKDANDSHVLKKLLQMNGNIVHGALFVDEEDNVIFRDTLQLENLDLNEIQATINSISLMMGEYAEDILNFAK